MNDPAEAKVELEGINYYTLLDDPPKATSKNAPCVLLIHALMSNLHMWDDTVRTLHRAGYRTLRYDHVGHHNTPPAHVPDAPYDLDVLTRHAHSIVKARTGQAQVYAVIGCSIGGVMALRYAMLFPEEVQKVVSIAAPGITSLKAAMSLWTQRIEQFESDVRTGRDTLCHATVTRWFPGGRAEDDEVRAEALQHVKTCSIEGYKVLADAIRGYDYAAEVGKIKGVKCLIVAGGEDTAVTPETLKDVAGMIEGSEFVVMENAGHLPPMHRPSAFGEKMVRFLQG